MELDSNWANYGFEGGETNERSSTRAYEGTYSRHLIVDGTSEGCYQTSVDYTAGTKYRIEGYVYIESGSFNVRLYDGASITTLSDTKTTATGAWTKFVGFYTAGNTTTGGHIQLVSATGAAEFYVDAVTMQAWSGGHYVESEPQLFPNESFFVTTWFDQAWTTTTAQTLSGWINSGAIPYETFTSSGDDITSAINTTGAGLAYATDFFTPAVGDIYKITFNFTLNSGDKPKLALGTSGGGLSSTFKLLDTGDTEAILIVTAATAGSRLRISTDTGVSSNFSFTNITLVKLNQNNAVQSTASQQPELYWEGATFGSEEIVDGGMEIDPTNNWDQQLVTLAEETTIVQAGSKSLKGTGSASGTNRVYQQMALSGNTIYKATAYTYRPTGNTGVPQLRIGTTKVATDLGNYVYNINDDSWLNGEVYFDTLGNTAVFLNFSGSVNTESVYMDTVSVKEVLTWGYPVVKFDGSDDYMTISDSLNASNVSTFTYFKKT
jgi:hypothetical protein